MFHLPNIGIDDWKLNSLCKTWGCNNQICKKDTNSHDGRLSIWLKSKNDNPRSTFCVQKRLGWVKSIFWLVVCGHFITTVTTVRSITIRLEKCISPGTHKKGHITKPSRLTFGLHISISGHSNGGDPLNEPSAPTLKKKGRMGIFWAVSNSSGERCFHRSTTLQGVHKGVEWFENSKETSSFCH